MIPIRPSAEGGSLALTALCSNLTIEALGIAATAARRDAQWLARVRGGVEGRHTVMWLRACTDRHNVRYCVANTSFTDTTRAATS